jgi:hypothetical protein
MTEEEILITYLATTLLYCPVNSEKMANNLRVIDILQLSSKWHAIRVMYICCFYITKSSD